MNRQRERQTADKEIPNCLLCPFLSLRPLCVAVSFLCVSLCLVFVSFRLLCLFFPLSPFVSLSPFCVSPPLFFVSFCLLFLSPLSSSASVSFCLVLCFLPDCLFLAALDDVSSVSFCLECLLLSLMSPHVSSVSSCR